MEEKSHQKKIVDKNPQTKVPKTSREDSLRKAEQLEQPKKKEQTERKDHPTPAVSKAIIINGKTAPHNTWSKKYHESAKEEGREGALAEKIRPIFQSNQSFLISWPCQGVQRRNWYHLHQASEHMPSFNWASYTSAMRLKPRNVSTFLPSSPIKTHLQIQQCQPMHWWLWVICVKYTNCYGLVLLWCGTDSSYFIPFAVAECLGP